MHPKYLKERAAGLPAARASAHRPPTGPFLPYRPRPQRRFNQQQAMKYFYYGLMVLPVASCATWITAMIEAAVDGRFPFEYPLFFLWSLMLLWVLWRMANGARPRSAAEILLGRQPRK